jgi:putative nucleotidyltransferase with HDIG domain
MSEVIENSFRGFVQALQTAKLYGTEHAKFAKSVDKAFESFKAAFQEKPDLVFGIVGEELAFEKEVMFELSKSTRPMIIYLKSRGIERMDFHGSLIKEELYKFLVFLVTPKEELKKEPQEHLLILGIRNINVGHIKSTEERVGTGAADDLKLYESSLENFNRVLDNVLEDKDVDYLDLQFNVSNIFESLTSRHQELLKLTVLKRYDQVTFAHILNVSVLSMFFASKLGLPREEVLDIGIAALFHDIGKTHVSRKIIKKTDKLTDEEFEAIKGHTVYGAEILLKYVDTLGQLPVLAAFEHHVKTGFQSYPKMPYPCKPHLSSAIIGVCDIYDALSARRSYKKSMPSMMVYEILLKEKEKLHSPELVDDFFKIMGVFPIGTLVLLSDSRIGVVRLQNEGDIFSPKVEVVYPADKREVLDLKGNTLGLKIEKSLDPLAEGQPYVSLI